MDMKVLALLVYIIALILLQTLYTTDWSDDDIYKTTRLELIIIPINLLFFTMFYKTKTLKTYLYFLAAFFTVLTILSLAAIDASKIEGKIAGKQFGVAAVLVIIMVMFQVGFITSNVLIVPFIIILAILAFLETEAIQLLKSRKLRIFYWVISQTIIVYVLINMLDYLQDLEEYMSSHTWDSFLVDGLGASQQFMDTYGNMIYELFIKFLFIAWFPFLIKLNNWTGTNMFHSFSGLIVIPTIVSFIMSNTYLMQSSNVVLLLPIFFISLSSLSLLYYLLLFIRTTRLNWDEANEKYFIPFVIHRDEKQSRIAKWVVGQKIHREKKAKKKSL